MSDYHKSNVSYRVGRRNMIGTLYHGEAGLTAPAVLIFPEGPGPGANVHERAARLATAGYVAFISDLHGDARILTDMAEIMGHLAALRHDPEEVRLRACASLEALVAQRDGNSTGIAAIGFCFGGTMALELGRMKGKLDAIVGFHCGLRALGAAATDPMPGPVLTLIGADDPSVTAEDRMAFEQEMRNSRSDWSMHLYGGVRHSFTDRLAERLGRPEFARYDLQADNDSWQAMLALFARSIKAN